MTIGEKRRRLLITMMENERDRQNEKHPQGLYLNGVPSMDRGMTVLVEEVGELAEAILEGDREAQQDELVQCVAVLFRMYEEVL